MQSQRSSSFLMLSGKALFRVITAGIALCCLSASGQNRAVSQITGRASEGRLRVAATVVTSVGLVIEPDGEQRIVMANAADPKDNVSRLQPAGVKLAANGATSAVQILSSRHSNLLREYLPARTGQRRSAMSLCHRSQWQPYKFPPPDCGRCTRR